MEMIGGLHVDWWLWFSIFTTVMAGVASGTVHLTDIIPDQYQKRVMGWLGLIVFVNQTILTTMHIVPK